MNQFVQFAFIIGLLLGGACFGASYAFATDSRVGGLLVNFSADFIMTGLTISVIDRLITVSNKRKLGSVPDTAKKAINDKIWSIVIAISFFAEMAVTITKDEIKGTQVFRDRGSDDMGIIESLRIGSLARIESIDPDKLTLGMYAEMLRIISQSISDVDGLIARYVSVFDPVETSKAIKIRDDLSAISKIQGLTTLTIPFFGKQTPDKLLDEHERNAFMETKDAVVKLTSNLL